jgi:dolichol-phosphate mannosyltransferase
VKKKLTIICCIYNEFNILKKNFYLIKKQFLNDPFYHEIIFIDNNSHDGSKNFLINFKKKNNSKNFKFIFNKKNIGKGGSIKKAIKKSTGDIGVIFDIDEYKYSDIKKGFQIFLRQNCSFLIGSRISKKKIFIYKKNYYGVILLTKLINFLFKLELTDSASATKFFVLKQKDLFKTFTNGFNFEFEVLCNFAKNKMKILEYQIDYFPRTVKEGKKIRAFRDGFKILITILIKRFI